MSAVHRHHVDGRVGPKLAYVDARLVTPMAPRHHRSLHLVLTDLDLEWPPDDEPLLVHRARRHAATAAWCDAHGVPLIFEPGAPLQALCTFWLDVDNALREASR